MYLHSEYWGKRSNSCFLISNIQICLREGGSITIGLCVASNGLQTPDDTGPNLKKYSLVNQNPDIRCRIYTLFPYAEGELAPVNSFSYYHFLLVHYFSTRTPPRKSKLRLPKDDCT
ncbi:hypothetical protein SK128_008535, partial [Halocaridina rubra]